MSAAMPPGLPSVILIGGSAGALSIARSLRPRGVRVYAIAPRTSHLRFSRHSQWIPLPKAEDRQTQWLDFLMQRAGEELRGAVVIPCEDDGLELVARRRSDLERRYVLIEANDAILLALLDKEATYALAREAGVPAPRIWPVRSVEEAASLRDLTYPCAVKPRHSHRFQRHFPFHKLLVTRNRDGLLDALGLVFGRGLEVFITEIIPGPEDAYRSYFTYMDESGEPLFHFTKRKIRQFPNGCGLGTYHVSDWNPDVITLGLQFLRGARHRGMANVEFKQDPRDGQLKLIECNPRVVFINELLRLSGIDHSLLVYNRLVHRALPPLGTYKVGVHVLRPVDDFRAFRVAHRRGELSWSTWARSLLRRQHLLVFRWTDPWPTLARLGLGLRSRAVRIASRILPLRGAPDATQRWPEIV